MRNLSRLMLCAVIIVAVGWADAVDWRAHAATDRLSAPVASQVVAGASPRGVVEHPPASLQAVACRVGRRGYRFKYAAVCQQRTSNPNCEAWFQNCNRCHDAADACLARMGARRSDQARDGCARCTATWSGCMSDGYQRYWPLPHVYKRE